MKKEGGGWTLANVREDGREFRENWQKTFVSSYLPGFTILFVMLLGTPLQSALPLTRTVSLYRNKIGSGEPYPAELHLYQT